MERERGNERGGDQAIWLDLVARLEQATADEHATTPWPDSENLGRDPLGPADPANAPANRGRVIRPASFMRFAEPPDRSAEPPDRSAEPPDRSAEPPDKSAEPDGQDTRDSGSGSQGHDHSPTTRGKADQGADAEGADAGDAEPDQAEDTGFAEAQPWRPSVRNLSAEDYLNLADLGYIDYDTGDSDERYIPPPLPPQPKLDPVAKGAWTALLGGPGYLFLATLLGWQVPGWAQLVAVIAFITGFLVLVIRLGDGPSRRDGPDQGAVV